MAGGRAAAEVVKLGVDASPLDSRNFREVARQLAAERGWFLTDQFAHPANPRVHEESTGPEIPQQCGGQVAAFGCGVGTDGTITGVNRFLKRYSPGAQGVLADPIGSHVAHAVDPGLPDFDTPYAAEEIGGIVVPQPSTCQ